MNGIVTFLRNALGCVIVFFDLITRGRKLKRSAQAQQKVESQLASLALYQFFACPFCIKTRRKMYKLNLPIVKRSISKDSPYRDDLLQNGGKIQAPCLRIENQGEVTWLYESKAIISYLEQRFA
ncbi:glutathione S-transferase N-terminal domain-containing protein [Glaciecola petra]|uniref:Glutathione S-transferase N-terminal domain-containing protein n=1 Tax=Glaciecola petra TaxID=3075602 RepID=A0ABU2ZQW9_9ALTE|nr:glutathione S-transferase N-terminal domain-containing protein [Aestuariibacter sp. P117]MDT0595035.1 glutathione S-transferase N-terminal domain-containing protein [Aestuariibacter sp. P117]